MWKEQKTKSTSLWNYWVSIALWWLGQEVISGVSLVSSVWGSLKLVPLSNTAGFQMWPGCAFIYVRTSTVYGCIWINWCQAKRCVCREEEEEVGQITSSENEMDELSALHWLMHIRTHTEQTQQEQIWRRQDKQAGGHCYSWSLQGPEGPNQFLHFRGKWWESGRSKEDGWDRVAANTRINNIHSLKEKIR